MLSTEGFREFAGNYVLFSHVTTRLDGEKYPDLLKEKGGRGFPYVVAMDAAGEVVAKLRDRTVEGFAAMMKDAGDYARLLPKKDRIPAEELRLLRLELRLGKVEGAAARARAEALKDLDAAGKADRDDLILGTEIEAALKPVNETRGRDMAVRIAAGKSFAEWWKAGREPVDRDYIQGFFVLMLDHAEDAKDPALFEKALGKLKEFFADVPTASSFLAKFDERLAKLKEAAPK